MKYILLFSFLILTYIDSAFAALSTGVTPDNGLVQKAATGWGLIQVLSFVQEFLLKVVLPIVIVGSALYIAYELFTAEGNEEKIKKAWKSLTYASIGVICIGLGYAVISIVSQLTL